MSPIDRLNWDDVRIFLAAMRASSLRQAADALGVSHPTARRRLEGLEEQLGLTLFERRSDGLHPMPQAVGLLAAAESVERAVQAVGRAAQAANSELQGSIRISMPFASATQLLMPTLAAFMRTWPDIEVIVQPSNRMFDLGQQEADVVIRFIRKDQSPQEDLAGRKVGAVFRAVYGRGDAWIGWYGEALDPTWIRHSPFPELPSRGGFSDPELQVAACAAGLGLAWLPCYLAEPMLPRVTEPVREWDIWVLVHPDLRKNARLRVFRDFVVDGIRDLAPQLEGRAHDHK